MSVSKGQGPAAPSATPVLCVSFRSDGGDQQLQFKQAFVIGRSEECEVCIRHDFVSRKHAQVTLKGQEWWIEDLHSSNGIYIDGQRVEQAPLPGDAVTVQLGTKGPTLSFRVEPPPRPTPPEIGSETMIARYINHYFANQNDHEPPGEHTIFVRKAFAQVQAKQKQRYTTIMAFLAFAVLAAGSYAFYEWQEAHKQKVLAQDIFYNMKALDVATANVEKLVFDTQNQQGLEEIKKYRSKRKAMEKSYDQFLATLHVYDPKMTVQQQLVLRVARIFGECELTMPPAFMSEINNYIKKWQSSGRLARAVAIAKEKGYAAKIAEELLAQDLPPQFFYLALQESNFDPYISGPVTRKGIAKGMWQFIPETALKYGLKLGPLFDLGRPDPGDDRHHWDRETTAAAKYIKDLYSTDAQASGLLVMACYNWGEDQVLPLVRGMPANPKERNFWRLLSSYRDKIPQETYDYVFYIASAAVIGENPRVFGFDFDNPLASLERK